MVVGARARRTRCEDTARAGPGWFLGTAACVRVTWEATVRARPSGRALTVPTAEVGEMSTGENEYKWQRAALVCGALALVLCVMGFAPTLQCVAAFPGNSPDLVELGVALPGTIDASTPMGEGVALCRKGYPLSNQRGPLLLSLVLGLLSVVSWSLSRSSDYDERDEEWIPQDRPNLPRVEEVPKRVVPDVIELDEELDLGLGGKVEAHPDDHDTVMDQVSTQQRTLAMKKVEAVGGGQNKDGFFVPMGYEGTAALYVDASSFMASDDMDEYEGRLDAPERPFKTLGAALEVARELIAKGRKIQVRVVPGVYQEAVSIPARVVVVNNRMPAGWPAREYIPWLKDQVDVDHPERVTLLAPADEQICVEIEMGGVSQGLYGLHLVGREETQQRGVSARRTMGTTLMACTVEGYIANGVRMEFCGREESELRARVVGCVFRENRAVEGGALSLADGSYDVVDSLFEDNRARNGGGIFGMRLKNPLMVERCEFKGNSAQSKELPWTTPRHVQPMKWKEVEGMGGGVFVLESVCKLRGCRFSGGGASYAGGAVASLATKLIVDGGEEETEIKGMRSRTGGAVFAVGWPAGAGMLKIVRTNLRQNEAVEQGGAVAVVGMVRAQVEESTLELNACTGEAGEGGALMSTGGAEAVLVKSLFRSNKATVHGGGAAASDGSLSVRGDTVFQDNVAETGAAGGLFFDATQMVGEGLAQKPRVLKLSACEFVGNLASKGCSAVFAGSMMEGAVGEVRVSSGEGVEFRGNNFAGRGRENNNVLFVWDGEPQHRGEELPEGVTTMASPTA